MREVSASGVSAPGLAAAVARAVDEGLLPAGAAASQGDPRPWPVVLLTALGAWLAAIPLLGVVSLLLGPLVQNAVGPYVAGALVLAGSVVVLRSSSVPLFVEQLAVPGLLVGGGSLGFGLFRDLPDPLAALVLAGVAFALLLWLRQGWLRVLLGVAMAALVGVALMERRWLWRGGEREQAWLACHLLLATGLAWPWVQGRWRGRRAALEDLSAGWMLVTLAGLALLAGMTFLVGGAMGAGIVGELAREAGSGLLPRSASQLVQQAASAALAAGGLAVLARAWPGLRQPLLMVVGVALVVLAWFMPTLGGVLLALACLLAMHRFVLAGAAAVAAAWVVGAFYYALAWPLADKALVLAGTGAVIGSVAWWLRPREAASPAAPAPALGRQALWVGLTAGLTLVVAVAAIGQKQGLITHGQPVYVELAPVDPRSLMQGDFMRLNFRMPGGLREAPSVGALRPKVVARRDERGVASLLRVAHAGEPLAPGEFLFELTPKDGRWILVTDAWFFREGDGERWARAKYGEFRVLPTGQALLVGMADEKLQPIRP